MNVIRSIIEECAVVIIAACVALGGFVEGCNLPLHQYFWNWTEEQSVASLGLGLLLGGIVVGMLVERRTSKIVFIGVLLLLLATSPLLWAMYAWKITYWQVYIPLCCICAFIGAALAHAVKCYRLLNSLDRRVIVLLAWICTLGVVGLFVNNTFRQKIRKLRIATFLTALIPISLGALGLWGAINADRLLFHLGENPPIGLPSLFGVIAYLISIMVVCQRKFTNVTESG